MRRGIGEAHLFALTLHLDQQHPDPAQQCDAGGLIVDRGAAASVTRHDPAQYQLVFERDPAFFEHGKRRMARRRRKQGGDAGLIGAVAHQPGRGADTKRQAQTVQQNALAGPGFAGEHRQPWAEREIEAVDQDHIADVQRGQHAR